jgi:hypothetical protein
MLDFCQKILRLFRGTDWNIIVSVRFDALPYNCGKPGARAVIFGLFTGHSIKLHLVFHIKSCLQILL